MMKQPVVTIVEDDHDLRRSLGTLIESVNLTCRLFRNGVELLERDLSLPGCILLDVRLPGLSGLGVQQELQRRGCSRPVIMMSGHADTTTAVTAMKRGAMDFVEKPVNPTRLVDLVQRAILRDVEIESWMEDCRAIDRRLKTLSNRERAVMDLVIQGLANKQIAAELDVSQRTVETHRMRLMRKMGATSVAQLVRQVDRVTYCSQLHALGCPHAGSAA
jgi:FixJ family two-component response regulator